MNDTEPTTDELNAWLAAEVMGWYADGGVWVDGEDEVLISLATVDDWHPTKLIAQAFMCEEAIPEDKRHLYESHLIRVWYEEHNTVQGLDDCWELFDMIHATAHQRCLALWRMGQEGSG